jgi:hypothetical protein
MSDEDRSPWPLLIALCFIGMVASCQLGQHEDDISALEERVTALEAGR